MPSSTGSDTLGSLPILWEALGSDLPGVPRAPSSLNIGVLTASPPTVTPDASRYEHGHWVMPGDTLPSLAAKGRIRLALGEAFLVAFSDFVVAFQGFGPEGWARPLGRALDADLDDDSACIIRRAGDTWLTKEDLGTMHGRRRGDPISNALVERLQDLLVSEDAAEWATIEVRLGWLIGDGGSARPRGVAGKATRAYLTAAARHAVRCAGPSHSWMLARIYPLLQLSSCWERVAATHRITTPPAPALAILRVTARPRAISNTIAWLLATDAPPDLIVAARGRASSGAGP